MSFFGLNVREDYSVELCHAHYAHGRGILHTHWSPVRLNACTPERHTFDSYEDASDFAARVAERVTAHVRSQNPNTAHTTVSIDVRAASVRWAVPMIRYGQWFDVCACLVQCMNTALAETRQRNASLAARLLSVRLRAAGVWHSPWLLHSRQLSTIEHIACTRLDTHLNGVATEIKALRWLDALSTYV